jgi:hypothetical protein
MHGKPFVLTDALRATIVEAAKKGLLEKDIAKSIGLGDANHFSNVVKKNFPEIDDLIEEGRHQGRQMLIDLSWEIITNVRDPARAQELQRLHRRLKTEESDLAQLRDADGKFSGGFTVEIIPNKKPSEDEPK